jgi:hypothetical protein
MPILGEEGEFCIWTKIRDEKNGTCSGYSVKKYFEMNA